MIIIRETKPIKSNHCDNNHKDILINHLDYHDTLTKLYVHVHKVHNNQKYNNVYNNDEELNFELLI